LQEYINTKEVAPGIVVHVIGASEKMMLCYATLKKGSILPEHRHRHEQTSFVVTGKLTFRVNGAERVCPAGTGLVFASNEPHSAVVEEDSTVADSFTPVREDYLK